MSEIISSVFNGVKDRTSGFYGYVAVTLFLFNWSNVYFLFFSTKSAEQKIKTISKFFDMQWEFLIPIAIASISYALAPYINVLIKSIHISAILLDKKIDFNNKNYIEDLEFKRDLKLSEKQQEADKLTHELTQLLERVDFQKTNLKEIIKESDEIKSKESEILTNIANKSDELQKLEINHAKEKQEYGNYEELRDMFNGLHNKAIDAADEAQNDKDVLLGLIISLINNGYIPESVEDIINNELFELGFQNETSNPLRINPRRYRSFIIDDNGKSPSKNSRPKEFNIPNVAAMSK